MLDIAVRSAAGAGDEGRDDVGGVAVEEAASSVVAHRRSRIGVRRSFLDIAQRDTGVEGSRDEAVPKGVRRDPLVDRPPHRPAWTRNPPSSLRSRPSVVDS